MTVKAYPHLRGVTIELVPTGVGRRTGYVIHCAECGATDVVFQKSGTKAGLPIEALNTLFSRKGWQVSGRGKHVCAACIAKKEAEVSKPRTLELKDRRRIVAALIEVYDDANSRYCDGSTDHTVAQGLSVPRAWVETIREENFGPSGGNLEMDRIASELGALQASVKKMVDADMERAAEGERQSAAIDELRKRLGGVMAAVGPRAGRA